MLKKIVLLTAGDANLPGLLMLPDKLKAIIIFCNGAGSGRNSPRNQLVSAHLYQAGFGSLLIDLLTAEEAPDYQKRMDLLLHGERLLAVGRWLTHQGIAKGVPIGYFAAGSGVAPVLQAASENRMIYAVVARGGRPDLAGEALTGIGCPVLLLEGSKDLEGISMAQSALQYLRGKKKLQLVHGSGDRVEDESGLQEVCRYAAAWFIEHLPAPSRQLRRRSYVS